MGGFLSDSDFVVIIICSTVTIVLIPYIFYRLSKSLSLPFIFVLSFYGVAALMRVLKLALANDLSEQIRSLINVTALCLQLFSLQYFIFQLSEFKVKMDSASHTDYMRRIKIIKVIKYVMLSIQFVTSFAKIYVEFVEPDPFKSSNDDLNHTTVLHIILISAISLRIMENLFMMFYAFDSIIYFLRMKINNLSLQKKQFTNFNIMIISFLIFALIFRPFAFTTIDSIIIARLVTNVSNNYALQVLWIIVRVFINPPRDLIELSLISYMLCYQDNRNRAASAILERPANSSINACNTESKEFFEKIGIETQNDF